MLTKRKKTLNRQRLDILFSTLYHLFRCEDRISLSPSCLAREFPSEQRSQLGALAILASTAAWHKKTIRTLSTHLLKNVRRPYQRVAWSSNRFVDIRPLLPACQSTSPSHVQSCNQVRIIEHYLGRIMEARPLTCCARFG